MCPSSSIKKLKRRISSPAAECTRDVPVGKLSLKAGGPSFTIGNVATVENGSIHRVDIRSRSSIGEVSFRSVKLRLLRELILSHAKLTRWNQIKSRIAIARSRERPTANIGW
jgi:hypothetical protein